jgi:hypothetical protein
MWKMKIVLSVIVALLFVSSASSAHAALTETQIQAILGLLDSFGAEQTVINNVNASLRGQTPTDSDSSSNTGSASNGCQYAGQLSRTLSEGSSGSDVSALQRFLQAQGFFTYPNITTYFGPATESAVQRWQAQHAVVSSGTPETTGHGVVGSLTRSAIGRICGTSSTSGQTSTNTQTSSAIPSITFSNISSGKVTGSFSNLPANSQIRFVSTLTNQPYTGKSTMVWSGGSGPLSIAIPNDLPKGTYYLRVTDYYNPNTTIAQSTSFQAGSTDIQTKSVVISSFTALPMTITPGQAVLFTWGANLTPTDVSYYGGGCIIEGLTQNNQALQVTAGFTDASSVTYVPQATATYTLHCSSGAKDGSPSVTKQITVNVNQPQTNPVVISSFSVSKNSVVSGQPVTFSWNSNLTDTDISYYGGFCSISALTSYTPYNQQIQITLGSGANGSVNYTPALTATYTLICSAGAKDGSPSATKSVTVNVEQGSLNATPSSGAAPLLVNFQGSGSVLTQSAGISFGDGTQTGEGVTNISHTYYNPGTYTALLHKDGAKGEVVATATITVY